MKKLDDQDLQSSFMAKLQNNAFSYAAYAHGLKHKFGTSFHGILVDTGATKGSSAGVNKYNAYCRKVGENPHVDNFKATIHRIEKGSSKL